VRASQQLMFPDPQPLVERLGRDFFRALPSCPGVYLMRDGADVVLYVGKAKNLRKRLTSYRVANPDRMPRRHLRMLRAVRRIEFEKCPDETSALVRESELLRLLKPKFNRAGVWPGTPRYLVWSWTDKRLELAVTETPETGWLTRGPYGSGAVFLRVALARMIWFAVNPQAGFSGIPAGWKHGRFKGRTVIDCGSFTQTVAAHLENLFFNQAEAFCGWVRTQVGANQYAFEKAAAEADLEYIARV